MAWIQSHQTLARHRKTILLARSLNITRAQAIGHLHFIWWWALDNAPTGDLSELRPTDVSYIAEWEGDSVMLLDALLDAGFIDEVDGGMVLHDWEDYAGRLVDKRAADATRKRLKRQQEKGNVRRTSDGQDADASRTVCGTSVRKSRVEKSIYNPPNPPQGDGGVPPLVDGSVDDSPTWKKDPNFVAFWQAYPRCDRKKAAAKAFDRWKRLKLGAKQLDSLLSALEEDKRSSGWLKDDGGFIPAPEVWLNKKRWEDDPVETSRGNLLTFSKPADAPARKRYPGQPWDWLLERTTDVMGKTEREFVDYFGGRIDFERNRRYVLQPKVLEVFDADGFVAAMSLIWADWPWPKEA